MTPWPTPPLPAPTALRLVHVGSASPRLVPPPLQVATWSSNDAADVLVLLAAGGAPTLDDIVAQVPDPTTLRPGTLVVILGDLAASGGLLGRWARTTKVPRALRASALLARGYERLGGGVDPRTEHDLAWGYVRAP